MRAAAAAVVRGGDVCVRWCSGFSLLGLGVAGAFCLGRQVALTLVESIDHGPEIGLDFVAAQVNNSAAASALYLSTLESSKNDMTVLWCATTNV